MTFVVDLYCINFLFARMSFLAEFRVGLEDRGEVAAICQSLRCCCPSGCGLLIFVTMSAGAAAGLAATMQLLSFCLLNQVCIQLREEGNPLLLKDICNHLGWELGAHEKPTRIPFVLQRTNLSFLVHLPFPATCLRTSGFHRHRRNDHRLLNHFPQLSESNLHNKFFVI